MKHFKTLGIVFVMLIALLGLSTLASAAICTNEPFEITKVEVNGQELKTVSEGGFPVYVEEGKAIPVVVFLQGIKDSYNVKVKAWIGGYEYGDIEAVTDIFQVIEGVADKKVLILETPEDMDASDNYTLNVEVYDDDQSCSAKYLLRLEEARHDVSIYDVILNPGTNVKAGQPLFVSARVENLGDNIEESIKVTARISQLGLEASDYVDQLITEQDEEDCEDGCKVSASANDLVLMIPSTTPAGDYNLDVIITYNRGHSIEKKSFTLHLAASQPTPTTTTPSIAQTLVNADTTSQKVAAGEGAIYKLTLANLGQNTATYTFEATGIAGWGVYSIDPSSITLGKDQTGSVNLYVSPNEGALSGLKSFALKAKSGSEIVKEITLNLDISEPTSTAYDATKKVLLVVFGVLIIILVIVAIIAAAKKIGSKEGGVEGQTYY